MITLDSPDGKTKAIVSEVGAALRELWLSDVQIVGAPDIYSGVTMFPWPNRINGASWVHNNQKLNLEVNDVEGNSALHGLVYEKDFDISQNSASECSLILDLTPSSGYPFSALLEVRYALANGLLKISQQITNLSGAEVPFAIGIHPYFRADETSTFISSARSFSLNSGHVDDTLGPNLSSAALKTSEFLVELSALDTEFIHIFTNRYSNKDVIWFAIEPQTSPANSLNTGIGVSTIKPGESKLFRYQLKIS